MTYVRTTKTIKKYVNNNGFLYTQTKLQSRLNIIMTISTFLTLTLSSSKSKTLFIESLSKVILKDDFVCYYYVPTNIRMENLDSTDDGMGVDFLMF